MKALGPLDSFSKYSNLIQRLFWLLMLNGFAHCPTMDPVTPLFQ